MAHAFAMLPLNWRVFVDLRILNLKHMSLNESTQAKVISWWHVPVIEHGTIWQFCAKIQISERTE